MKSKKAPTPESTFDLSKKNHINFHKMQSLEMIGAKIKGTKKKGKK